MIEYYGNEINWVPTLESSNLPLFQMIAKSIESDIQSGKLLHGVKMPPQRVIANYLGINHGTVTRAYKLCEEKGLLKGIIGKGTFVSGSAGLPVELLTDHEDQDIISLGMALPVYEMNPLIEQRIKEVLPSIDYNVVLKYCPPEGHLKHRYIAANWLKQYGIEALPENMIISSGTQNALAVILMTLFDKSDRMIVDEFTYTGLKSLAKYLGIILVPVKGDLTGMDLEALEQVCHREKAKGIYLMPDCQNPTSVNLSEEKRQAISQIIRKHDLLLIEDGTCSFTAEKKTIPISTRIPERSFYIHGTSKVLNPTFRISFMVTPSSYAQRLQNGINNLVWMASPFNAEVVTLLIATGKYDDIEAQKIKILRDRNALFNDVFKGFSYIPAETALFRYLELPKDRDAQEVEKAALELGVQVFSVNRFLAGMNPHHQAIRVSISSAKDQASLVEGMEIIKKLLSEEEVRGTLIV